MISKTIRSLHSNQSTIRGTASCTEI